jgi:mannosyl-glycoprotein endo-beta-N-acetylglucosaminidase
VIWYDAVTVHGKLDWQNALTGQNRAFFDLSDGIFTNYCWKAGTPGKSAAAAGGRWAGCGLVSRARGADVGLRCRSGTECFSTPNLPTNRPTDRPTDRPTRAHDVYFGCDVFGRGTYGGGGHGAAAALAAARAAGASAALFAPAWTLECHAEEDFEELQEQWWRQVRPALAAL